MIIGVAVLPAVQMLTLPWIDVVSLKRKNPTDTAFMREQEDRAREMGKPFRKQQVWVPLKRISKSLVDAVIVAEDGTFWTHSGFDWFEFRESIERDWKEKRAARGASTITQQLVKNLYLSASKNPLRKLKEWELTWFMEHQLTKSRILEIYLNVIEWGNGVYGAEAAARRYFGKSADELSLSESLRLASIIPSPRRHPANEDSRYVLRRSDIIKRRLEARGWIPIAHASDTTNPAQLELPEESEFENDTTR